MATNSTDRQADRDQRANVGLLTGPDDAGPSVRPCVERDCGDFPHVNRGFTRPLRVSSYGTVEEPLTYSPGRRGAERPSPSRAGAVSAHKGGLETQNGISAVFDVWAEEAWQAS